MIYLYLYKSVENENGKSLNYIESSLKCFFSDCGGAYTAISPPSVFKDENGRPLTDVDGVFVSASHTEKVLVCGISSEPIGIDIQVPKKGVKYEAIAERFFTAEEGEYIAERGIEAFYDIWTRKEAFVKYKGRGLGYGLSKIHTVKDGRLSDCIEGVRIQGQIKDGLFFAVAGGDGDMRWIENCKLT